MVEPSDLMKEWFLVYYSEMKNNLQLHLSTKYEEMLNLFFNVFTNDIKGLDNLQRIELVYDML